MSSWVSLARVIVLGSLLSLVAAQGGLVEIENQFRAAYELGVGAKYAAAVEALERRYSLAIEKAILESTKEGKLEEAFTLKQERDRIAENAPIPATDDGSEPEVAKFRAIYRSQLIKLQADRDTTAGPIVEKFGAALKALQEELAAAGKLEEALVVKDYLAAGLLPKLTRDALAPVPVAAAPERPFENSLGMRFVPVPIAGGATAGKTIRFSIWETRVGDYEEFVKETKTDWPNPGFKQGADHPAVNVSWKDAVAFCDWLTKEERRKRKIGPKDIYRLPTDHEWSCAAGIDKDEDASHPPNAKDGKVPGFPWGKEFPPPPKSGNYNGEETARNPVPGQRPIEGYKDGFERTSPVGSFPANRLGLFDVGGNVWEWCQEWYDPAAADRRVLRGGSWYYHDPSYLTSSRRFSHEPTRRYSSYGFRCVLEVGSGT